MLELSLHGTITDQTFKFDDDVVSCRRGDVDLHESAGSDESLDDSSAGENIRVRLFRQILFHNQNEGEILCGKLTGKKIKHGLSSSLGVDEGSELVVAVIRPSEFGPIESTGGFPHFNIVSGRTGLTRDTSSLAS